MDFVYVDREHEISCLGPIKDIWSVITQVVIVTYMSPVSLGSRRQFFPPLDKQHTGIAHLSGSSLFKLETVHKVLFILLAVSKAWTANITSMVTHTHFTDTNLVHNNK